MKLVNLIEEDFVNYKKPGMFLGFPYCSGKCNSPGRTVCQNEELRNVPERELIDISIDEILERFENNRIPEALICGGLEPFDSFNDLLNLCHSFRMKYKKNHFYTSYPIIIYTGYYPHEIKEQLVILKKVSNIIIKFGRYIPGNEPHPDPYLGINLASDNQYAIPLDVLWDGIDLMEYLGYSYIEKEN